MPSYQIRPGDTVVLATHNPDKAEEMARFLAPFGVRLLWAKRLGLPKPVESGHTCLDNAVIKAQFACDATGYISIADDCGLFVAALGGRPGPHISRLAETLGGWDAAIADVLARVEGLDRAARFVCGLAVAFPQLAPLSLVGEVEGSLSSAPRGLLGHGMDPIFIPPHAARTFGELTAEEREAINHRAAAFARLRERLGMPAAGPKADHRRPRS